MSTGPGWRRAIPARPAYLDFLQIPPMTSAGKVSIARAELVVAITARTGRRTVAMPGRGAQGSASGGPQNASELSPSASRRVACHALNRRCRRVSSRKTGYKCPRRLGAAETRGVICNPCVAEARLAGLTGNCYTTNQTRESTCLTMLRNECCVGYWKAGIISNKCFSCRRLSEEGSVET